MTVFGRARLQPSRASVPGIRLSRSFALPIARPLDYLPAMQTSLPSAALIFLFASSQNLALYEPRNRFRPSLGPPRRGFRRVQNPFPGLRD